MDTEKFKAWFGDSKVSDPQGMPLVVYRGQHGNEGVEPKTNLASITFTSDPAVAGVYAMSPNDSRSFPTAECPVTIPAYLSIQNPIINNLNDPFVDFSDLNQKLGRDIAEKLARKFSDYIINTNNWEERFWGRYDDVDALLDAEPDKLNELYMDAFVLLDDFYFVGEAQARGFDGGIHQGNGESMDAVEYHVFRIEQIKSVIGVNVDFDPADPDNETEREVHQARARKLRI